MKKIYLILVLGCLTIWNAQAQFPEGFETGVPPTGWVSFEGVNGLGTTESWETTSDSNSGSLAAFIGHEDTAGVYAEDWLVTPQFTPGASTNYLEFEQKQFDPDFDYFTTFEIRVSTASQTTHADFVTIDSQAELDFDNFYSPHYVDLTAYEGIPIYLAFVIITDDGEDWYIDDVNLVPFANAPDCDVTNVSLADGATDVDIELGSVTVTWNAPATGDAPGGYDIYLGTTSGSLALYEEEAATSVDFNDLDYDTTYYWQVIPFNVGGQATGCTEFSFTTESAPVGSVCADAISVPSLPYNHTGNTGNYENDYTSDPGNSCGTNNSYLSGYDVVYEFSPASDEVINIILSNLSDEYAGVFVYEDCNDIGSICTIGTVNEGSTDDLIIDDFEVFSGTTYYIVISTWANPETIDFELDIIVDVTPVTINSCGGVEGSITVVTDCLNSGGFFIDIEATSMGTLSSIEVSDDQGSGNQILNAVGTLRFGPYVNLTDVIISLSGDGGACTYDHTPLTQETCPIDPDYQNDFSTYPGTDWRTATSGAGFIDYSTSGWQTDDFANDPSHLNGKGAKVNIWGTTRDEFIVSPEFNLLGGTFYLNLDIALTDFINTTDVGVLGSDDYVALYVTQDDWTTNTELVRWDSSSSISNTGQSIAEIELTGYNEVTRFAIFAFSDTSNADNEFFIDNFSITNNSLSIADNVIEGFELYPNPATNYLNMRALDNIEKIGVYNLLGQEVKRSYPNSRNTQLEISDLSFGVYVVKVEVGDKLASYKIVKH